MLITTPHAITLYVPPEGYLACLATLCEPWSLRAITTTHLDHALRAVFNVALAHTGHAFYRRG